MVVNNSLDEHNLKGPGSKIRKASYKNAVAILQDGTESTLSSR